MYTAACYTLNGQLATRHIDQRNDNSDNDSVEKHQNLLTGHLLDRARV